MKRLFIHILFILGVLGLGAAVGRGLAPQEWYAQLTLPPFAPPAWLFGPVWTVLFILIGWAGARSFLDGGAIRLWAVQMALNLTWTPVFFGLRAPWAGLAVIVLLLGAILAYIRAEWPRDRGAAMMFLPYLCWVSFAAALNAAIAVLN